MHKVIITAAAAVSALVIATPAAAQNHRAPQQGYGQGYGHNNNYGHVRSLQVRIDNLQRRIDQFDSRNRISEREARRLREESRDLERQLQSSSRNGLNQREYANINYRIQQLEQRINRDARDGNRWGQNDGRGNWSDRNGDGRNDRN